MNKKDILNKIKSLEGLDNNEKAYLVNLVNTTKKYGLVWEDKPEDVEEELRTKLPILKEVKERAIINDTETEKHPNHILIEGDNLHALTSLTFTHEGLIDLIYIDPPYNTGNKSEDGTTDFKYNDDYVDKEDSYRHSKWLSFIYKRLIIARSLLAEDGFICVSIDDNEIAQLKIILDDLFNQNTKIVAVKMSEASGLKMGATNRIKNIPKYKEYIVFAKREGIRNLDIDNVKKEEWDNEYNIFIEGFTKKQRDFIDDNLIDPSEDVLNEIDNILSKISLVSLTQKLKDLGVAKKDELDWKFENAWRIVRTAASSSVKRLADDKRKISKQNYFSVISKRDKLLYLVKGDYSEVSKSPRVQFLFADTNLMVHPGDFWQDIKTTGLEAEGGVEFKNGKKPLKLMNRILNSHLNKNTKILDFFAGSGSTFHSALELNNKDAFSREVILVTNNENNICENTTYTRCKNIIEGFNSFEGYKNNNLRYYQCNFVERAPSLNNKKKLTLLATELLCIKENCYNEITSSLLKANWHKLFANGNNNFVYVIYDDFYIEDAIETLTAFINNQPDEITIKVYVFSNGQYAYAEEFESIAANITLAALPDAIYKAYQNVLPKEEKEFIPTLEDDVNPETAN
ncbi:site-specific DNA-methyltransferase [Mariniflexile aquimaris]|uniref:site-specific DNA-methyltransferase (adenine-specific) n=1 Tax=Mariniflexile aquimaris TaxID=881009 RepID=A0ABW3BSP3_9FLAO